MQPEWRCTAEPLLSWNTGPATQAETAALREALRNIQTSLGLDVYPPWTMALVEPLPWTTTLLGSPGLVGERRARSDQEVRSRQTCSLVRDKEDPLKGNTIEKPVEKGRPLERLKGESL